jgi:hypothetical protein
VLLLRSAHVSKNFTWLALSYTLLAGQIPHPEQESPPQGRHFVIRVGNLTFQPLPANQSKEALPLLVSMAAAAPGFLNNGLKRPFKSSQSLLVQVSRYAADNCFCKPS